MLKVFDNLLVSCPNGGGLFFLHSRRAYKLDLDNTTGLALDGDLLVQAIQPATIRMHGADALTVRGDAVKFHDVHDVLLTDDALYAVGTAGNEILKLGRNGRLHQRWVFTGEEDSMHVNCLARWNGRIVFSAFGEFNDRRGYKGFSTGAGFVQDLNSSEKLITGLSQPHSLCALGDHLLVANSEKMQVLEYDSNGELLRTVELDGYTRGICVAAGALLVGLSASRNVDVPGVDTATVVALDMEDWRVFDRIRLPVPEVYAIHVVKPACAARMVARVAERTIGALDAVVSARDARVGELEALAKAQAEQVGLRQAIVDEQRGQLEQHDARIGELDRAVAERDALLRDLRATVETGRRAAAEGEEQLASLRTEIELQSRAIAERDGRLDELRLVVDEGSRSLAERDARVGELDRAVAERNALLRDLRATVEAGRRAVAEGEEQLASLRTKIELQSRAIAERDGRLGELRLVVDEGSRSLAERDARVGELNRAVAERDVLLRDLRTAVENERNVVVDREGRISQLDRAVAERDSMVSELRGTVAAQQAMLAERDGAIERLQQADASARARISAMENSHSWRMTASFRWIGEIIKATLRRVASSHLVSRLVTAMLLLPAAGVFYGGLPVWFREWRAGRGAFTRVIEGQWSVRERLRSRNRLFRWTVYVSFSAAMRVIQAGSTRRSLSKLVRVLCREGTGGVRERLKASAPGGGDALVQALARRCAELPVFVKDVACRILVADYRVPRPDVSAGERATVGILRDLCAFGYEVVFLPNDMESSLRYAAPLWEMGVQLVTRDSGFRYSAHYLEQHGGEFGAFYFIRVDVAETLLPIARRVAPDSRVIFHAPDCYFLREMRNAELRDDADARARALQTRDREVAMMSRSDRVVVVSPAEAPVLQKLLPDTPISLFPVLYAPVVERPLRYRKRRDIFFLGGFGHPPNVSAVQWFVAEIWPLIHAALPRVEFHIIGAEAPESVIALAKVPGVKVVGYVPDLEPVMQAYRVGVAPLRYGAGIKGKVAATMGVGTPCVCTAIAAEGMGIENDVHALVEDDPTAFASAVVKLYQDKKIWKRLARNGQALVEACFGDAANRASLLQVLDRAEALPVSLFSEFCQKTPPVRVPVTDADVDVSIIVPVFNKWELTRACLTSVIQTSAGSGVTYELLLADDGSTDETVHAARYFPGLRVVKTPRNLGFLRNCNNAARQARGRYVLLLNNDTVVLPGWLGALYRTMDDDASIAIVGSKLLYPDRHIQDAGGGLLANADGVSIGRWLWESGRNYPVRRREPLFEIRRETDYLSGASMLVRKSFWNEVGGFDERYVPAYCEDSDLAMAARAKGMQVVYEPASEVIHFEHLTYQDETNANHDELQARNKVKLFEKWKDAFQKDHLPPGSAWYQVAAHGERSVPAHVRERHKGGSLNILYFSPFPSHPDNHGNQATIKQFGRYFQSMGHKVHFALLRSHLVSDEQERAMRAAWDTLDMLPNTLGLGSNGQPIPFDGWYEEGLGERIRLLCAKYDIDMVFCSYIFQSKLLEFVPDYVLKVIDTHDKMGDRYEMLRKNGQPLEFFSCTPEEEGAYLRRADVVVARRDEEARYFDSVTGRHSAIVIPHVEKPRFIQRVYSSLANVGIVASANRVNLAIVREFLETVDATLPGATCPFTIHIAGQIKSMAMELPTAEGAIFKRPWVTMHGFVPDIEAFYRGMDVVVSPVTMGTGINVKTVQAMAYGMPLLTTACGSKGIATGDPRHTHAGLAGLVTSLFELLHNPEDLNRLATLSRKRYKAFFDEARSGFRTLLQHPKLGLPCVDDVAKPVPYAPVTARRDDPKLKQVIYDTLYDYYRNGERSACVLAESIAAIRMDGSSSPTYVVETVTKAQVHDEDFKVFKLFEDSTGCILDIGANWGYSVASIWAVAPRCSVVSFEPIVSYQASLQAIKELKPEQYDYRMIGLGAEEIRLKFVVPVVNGVAVSALASAFEPEYDEHINILAGNIVDAIVRWMPGIDPIEFSVLEFEALVRRLDDVLADEPDLTGAADVLALKIDVEGLEAQVLFGAEALLRRCTPLVMLEGGNRHAGLPEYMAKLGYFYYELEDGTLHSVATFGNAINGFFVHHDRLDTLVAAGLIARPPPPPAPDSDVRDKASELTPVYIEGKTGLPSPEIRRRRRSLERELTDRLIAHGVDHATRSLRAVCHTCGEVDLAYSTVNGWCEPPDDRFVVNWREHLVCPRCGLNSRMRASVHFLDAYCELDRGARVYITEENTQLFRVLHTSLYPKLVGSEFLGDECALGETYHGIRNEDITRLTFPDASLDAVLSFDVLEHVPDFRRAMAEVNRCLVPGGTFLLSVPFDPQAAKTVRRAEVLADGSIHHLLPPEYHGDPVHPGAGILAYQLFGWDLLSMLRETGFERVRAVDYWSREYGYLGNCLLFNAQKALEHGTRRNRETNKMT